MKNFKYSLAKKGKWICPQCGKKTFVCYVDENGDVLDESVGKCDRADKCAHHYPPRDYFKDNNLPVPRMTTAVKSYVPSYVPPSYIDPELFKKSVEGTKKHSNNFALFLFFNFEREIAQRLENEYYIGTSKHWKGATVFWQVDRFGHVHTGKIMLYEWPSGKRVKEPFSHITWVHKVLNLPNFNLKQCLFGEHLLDKYPDKPVAVVESEKTAIILSAVLDDVVAVACGGCGNLTASMCEPLRGREVILFPDEGKYDEWSEKGKAMSYLFKSLWISGYIEYHYRGDGSDIADFIIENYFMWRKNGGGEIHLNLELERLK